MIGSTLGWDTFALVSLPETERRQFRQEVNQAFEPDEKPRIT